MVGGIDLVIGPKNGTCLVIRQIMPPSRSMFVTAILKSSWSRLLYDLSSMNSFATSRVRALIAAPRLNIFPQNCEILSQNLMILRLIISWRAATLVLEKKWFSGWRRALWRS